MDDEVDAHTGLANYRAFQTALHESVEQATARGDPLTLVLLDIKSFKAYNGAKGHAAGDALLVAAAAGFRRALRPHDMIARLGGDEFGVLLNERRSDGQLRGLVQRLRRAVPAEQQLSVALARFRKDDTAASILSRAELALYEASQSGD